MDPFRSAARVGCLRGGATRLLEEWPPIPRFREDGQNPAYRPSGIFLFPAKAGAQDRLQGAFLTSGSKTALSLKLQRGFWAPAFAGALRLASGGNRD